MPKTTSNNPATGCVILLIVAALAGYVKFRDHRAEQAEARRVAAELQLERKAAEQAIELAKRADTLIKGRLFISKPAPETITNDFQLRQMMSEMKGDLRVIGWQAKRHDADTFVVTYSYEHDGKQRGFPFEVNATAGVVRAILGDPVLQQKYGWSPETTP